MKTPLNTDFGPVGVAPAYQQVSDFQFGEMLSATGVVENAIDFQVPANMPTRKIYAWLWAANATANWYVKGQIGFWRQQSALGSLPLQIGGGTFGTQTLVSVCTSAGQNVQDCLGIYVSNPTGTQPASIILQPLYINGEFDRMTFSVVDALNINTIRALVACISSS